MADLLLMEMLKLATPGPSQFTSTVTLSNPGSRPAGYDRSQSVTIRFTKHPELNSHYKPSDFAHGHFATIRADLAKRHIHEEGILSTDFGQANFNEFIWIVAELKAAMFTLKGNTITIEILQKDARVKKCFNDHLNQKERDLLSLLQIYFDRQGYPFFEGNTPNELICNKPFFAEQQWQRCKHMILSIGKPLLFENISYTAGAMQYGNLQWDMGFDYRLQVRVNAIDSGFVLTSSKIFDADLRR